MTYVYLFIAAGLCVVFGMLLLALLYTARDQEVEDRATAALWDVINQMRLWDIYRVAVRDILEKHGVEIPEDERVW